MIRVLTVIVVVLCLLWSGYWIWGSRTHKSIVENLFGAMPPTGWQAGNAGVSVSGFPNRFDATVSYPEFVHLNSGIGWKAPFVQLLALSYQPYYTIIVFPGEHTIALPSGDLAVNSRKLRASVKRASASSAEPSEIVVEVDSLTATSPAGQDVVVEKAVVALRRTEESEPSYDVAIYAKGLKGSLAGLSPEMAISLETEMKIGLERPLEVGSCDQGPSRLVSAAIERFSAQVNGAFVDVEGELEFGPDGSPTGETQYRLTNWQNLLDVGAASGIISHSVTAELAIYLNLMTILSGMSEEISGELNVKSGQIAFGQFFIDTGVRIPDLCGTL